MLSVSQIRETQRRRRSPYSDKQHYHEYILQRIEGYKNSIGRDELLRLGDEAASELHTTSEGQFVLTEVLMLESVDRLIMKRLALRSYRRWRQQFIKLREAQRTPTHWGLEPNCCLARLLPRVEPEDELAPTPLEPSRPGRGCEHILLVEDEDAVRSVAARVLLNQGYTVIQARNGEEALDLLSELGDGIDLVLTDVVMPDMGGLALAEKLKATKPELRLLYMSGYSEADKLQPGMNNFQFPFLQKPFSAESLIVKVREVLDAKRS